MKLNRSNHGSSTPEVRIVHLGLGAFFRAHQAWYTAHAKDGGEWGIAAFTGRRPEASMVLEEQDGLYTLITRGANGEAFEVIDNLVETHPGSDLAALVRLLSSEQVALVTLTITEAGYGIDADGLVNGIEHLILKLRAGEPETALGRLAHALNERRKTIGVGLALVPCDNVPANGALLRGAMEQLFSAFGVEALHWLRNQVTFVSTSIDRITPKTTDEDIAAVAKMCGYGDMSPVVTEPFRDWVLQGDFPLGRPNWESAGAKFVTEIEPFENRKLWFLNGAHSLLAYLGQLRGHSTVASAIADESCRLAVTEFWEEAERTLNNPELRIGDYRQALLERFENPRIAHQLAQIAIDGSTKLRLRVVPTALAELERGNEASGASLPMAAWIAFLLENPNFQDSNRSTLESILAGTDQGTVVRELLAQLNPYLASNQDFLTQVRTQVSQLRNNTKVEK